MIIISSIFQLFIILSIEINAKDRKCNVYDTKSKIDWINKLPPLKLGKFLINWLGGDRFKELISRKDMVKEYNHDRGVREVSKALVARRNKLIELAQGKVDLENEL